MSYTIIAIIYNPKSTGSSEALAREMKERIRSHDPSQKVELVATEHAGHAEELAYSMARSSKRPLIISSSGDGGYNEVVNGIMKAQLAGAHPTAGLLPAGNANDHHRNLHDEDSIARIMSAKSVNIDLLKITGTSNGKRIERYAHSYIGFGLTSIIGKRLNSTKLSRLTEFWIVARSLFTTKPVSLKIGKNTQAYESIIFSNVEEMSKYLKVSQSSSVKDGKFEVTIFRRPSRLELIMTLLKAVFGRVQEDAQMSEFTLRTVDKTLVQADGEIIRLDADSDVTITIEPQVLASII